MRIEYFQKFDIGCPLFILYIYNPYIFILHFNHIFVEWTTRNCYTQYTGAAITVGG